MVRECYSIPKTLSLTFPICISGTLTPIVPNPEDAILSEQVIKHVEVAMHDVFTCNQ